MAAAVHLGHANTEDAGMGYVAKWMEDFIQEVPIKHVPAGDPFIDVEIEGED